MAQAGLADHQGECGPEEWVALQAALGHGQYQLKIFDNDTFNGLVYIGPEAPKVISLWLVNHHFHVITAPAAFFERSYFCDACNKGYNNLRDHQICPARCSSCFRRGHCGLQTPMVKCNDCNRFFKNSACLNNHRATWKNKKGVMTISICEQMNRCGDCQKEFYTRKGHQCGIRTCTVCKIEGVAGDHQCFIQPYTGQATEDDEDPLAEQQEIFDEDDEDNEDDGDATEGPPRKKRKMEEKPATFIIYDFESRQDEKIGENANGDINIHHPNLVIAHKVCDKCCHLPTLGPCSFCKENHVEFDGDECLDKFCEWLFTKKNKGSIAIAHNSKGYIGQFILEYVNRNGLKPKTIISRGLGVMYMEVGGIKFKDSLNFLPMALASLPKAFDISGVKKGYFPHMFNRAENWTYVGPWPDAKYYQPDQMRSEERSKFLDWYEQQKDKEFNFQTEIRAYCESDVEVLRKCCIKFRQLFLDIGNIDPLVESITIASACNRYYRKHHLPINEIAVVPHGGYRKEEKQSIIALKWLKWLAETTGQRIQHKLNGGEVKIGGYRVDGLCDKTIYEFYGCFWHGCKDCMEKRTHMSADGILTAREAYQKTADRKRYLESLGYTVIEKWECQLRAELKANVEMATFFDGVKIVEPLDAREALYGGRTNATVLYRKAGDGEKISYIDVLSLYPYICKYGRFPTGHPKVITENFEPMDGNNMPYEGLVKCRVLPPTNLLHPVLPFRANKKLTFPLCSQCAITCQQDPCNHTDEERALNGAWVTLELKKALELGYRILEVHEVWHFEEYAQYDPSTKTGGLFAEYINDFLRIKQEADGWPAWADTVEKQRAFAAEWRDREGIELRPERMIKNVGLRALAKLMLNSFWGKFGQRSKLPKTEYFTNPAAFFKRVFDPATAVKTVRVVNEKMVALNYEQADEFVEVLSNTNSVIAAYTTAQARLKLYSYIEQLQERVLYFDTDSIIYVTRPGDLYQPKIANYLGEMTDELEKDYGIGSFITEFVSGGPKHYGYKVWSANDQQEHTTIKVKGFKISHELTAVINLENLKTKVFQFVQNRDRLESMVTISRIERDVERRVKTVTMNKVYRVTYDKRVVQNDFTSLPYGYRV